MCDGAAVVIVTTGEGPDGGRQPRAGGSRGRLRPDGDAERWGKDTRHPLIEDEGGCILVIEGRRAAKNKAVGESYWVADGL
jgi:hypothetical protein